MKFLLTILLSLSLFAAQSTIVKITGNGATIDPVDLPKDTSGIVIHHFDQTHSTIVARAILQDSSHIKFDVYDALRQPNLPKPNIKPQVGDSVILGYLYDRAIIIAPNYTTYAQIANKVHLNLVHPDLFAAELSKAKEPAPRRKDFRNFCNKFALAKVIIALKNEARVLDCYSFSTIDTLPIQSDANNVKKPFYTRLRKIPGSIFSFFGSDTIDNYFNYYTRLVEGR